MVEEVLLQRLKACGISRIELEMSGMRLKISGDFPQDDGEIMI